MDERLDILRGDITKFAVDAIVNAANTALAPGGGVCGAIFRAAGSGLAEECARLGGCPTGEARITRGYGLPAKWVIHTPGPVWEGGGRGEPEQLAGCYRSSLALAAEHGLATVAFPSISTGTYCFPIDQACRIALREIARGLEQHPGLERVTVVCFDEATLASYAEAREALAKS